MAMNEEIFDIFDADMKWVGTAPRSEVHAKGYWHQSFQCWIVKGEPSNPLLLLQARHESKDTYPGLLDISCAGHLSAGERIEDGVRELKEELGLQVSFGKLRSCGVVVEEDMINEKLIDREFCHLFMYPCDQPLFSYRIQAEELTGLYEISVRDFKSLLSKPSTLVTIEGVSLNKAGRLEENSRMISKKDLVPHKEAHYSLLFREIARWSEESKMRSTTEAKSVGFAKDCNNNRC
jgi:isopentenyldiphosphate isomerase